MPVTFNIRHLERNDLHLQGETSWTDLGLDGIDELITVPGPVEYDLDVSMQEQGFLVQGCIRMTLRCECARCLRPFDFPIGLEDWSCLLLRDGEDKVLIINDSVDLTPYLREDIVLALPQHPLCKPECGGLKPGSAGQADQSSSASQTKDVSSAWAELNKLKF